MKFTVIGAGGLIGSHLFRFLRREGHDVSEPRRDTPDLAKACSGNVIDCAGYTGDFKDHPIETVQAHVCLLASILAADRFDSLLYLSSARMYRHATGGTEMDSFQVDPTDIDNLYDLSKLMGEACVSLHRDPMSAWRTLSNVYDPSFSGPNFLDQVVSDGCAGADVLIKSAPDGARDYVWINDVVPLLTQIAVHGRHRLYNVAAGELVTNQTIGELLKTCARCQVTFQGITGATHPDISIDRAREEFGFNPQSIVDLLPGLITEYSRTRSVT